MKIERIDSYQDSRFSQRVLYQHGCFLIGGAPYEVEITAPHRAVVRGENLDLFPELMEEFRFFTPQITEFYDETGALLKAFPEVTMQKLPLDSIQPSQFYVDEEKLEAVGQFITRPEDIIIQVTKTLSGWICLDGHTRLYLAVSRGWDWVYALEDAAGDYLEDFVEEAIRRNIHRPRDLQLINHEQYEKKWNQLCDAYFQTGSFESIPE